MKIYYIDKNNLDDRLNAISGEEIKKYWIENLGVKPPDEILVKGKLVLGRHLPLSRIETKCAYDLACELGRTLTIPTYVKDKYVQVSKEKRNFLRGKFEDGTPLNLFSKKEMHNFDRDKFNLEYIVLLDGTSLYDFHLNLLQKNFPKVETFDLSDNFNGKRAFEYYPSFLAFFGGFGCLLENFHGEKSEGSLKKFTENVFEPAFDKVYNDLGFKPCIYRFPYKEGFERYVDGD